MLEFLAPLRELSFLSLVLRLLFATLCGTAIGLERSAKNRPAGFRTHILVCLGAAVAALTGHFLYLGLNLPADVTRISGQVITGLGFIGAGTIIITQKKSIKGLTTAAVLWTTGIIGLAIGSGYFEGGIAGTVLVLLAETGFFRLAQTLQRKPDFTVRILYNEKNALDQVLRWCKDHRISIRNLQIRSDEAESDARYVAEVMLRGNGDKDGMLSSVKSMPGVIFAEEKA